MVGSALLQLRFTPAAGHNQKGIVTYGAVQRTYALPELIQVVNLGDFESVLTFGVGLAKTRRSACTPCPAGPGGPRCPGAVPDGPVRDTS